MDTLHQLWQPLMAERIRMRDILNGGRGGVLALFGNATKYRETDLPAANFIDSGLERLGQRLGHAPDVKVTPPLDNDGPRKRFAADKLVEIVQNYDSLQRLELQLPQQTRWLPGYGFCVWTISQHRDHFSGHWYPVGRIRNAFDCFPGSWDADEDPEDLAITRIVDRDKLAKRYPAFKAHVDRSRTPGALDLGGGSQSYQQGSWGLVPADGALLTEYYDSTGCYMLEHTSNLMLDYWPNPVELAPFVVVRRFTFDQMGSQFTHVIGLMSMLAKLNILAFIATEDATFRETNVIGDMAQTAYKRGRFATNHFPPGTQIIKPAVDSQLFQAWQQIDRLERHFRIGANYPVTTDGDSPTSFSTGQGIDRLTLAFGENISEYQTALRYGLTKLDALRLCWDEHLYSGLKKPMYANIGENHTGDYDPSRIKGWYSTDRAYGMMAGWDEPQKIVGGLQLLGAGVIDITTFQENLYGLKSISRINERRLRDDTKAFLMQTLSARGQQGDPAAITAMKKIMANPRDIDEILDEVFPDQPVLPPGAPPGMPGMPGAPGGEAALGAPPEDVMTILSRLETTGELGGGAQTVAQV